MSSIMNTRLENIILDINRRKTSIGCAGRTGLLLYLEELGFSHKPGKSANHRVFTHAELSAKGCGFTTFGIDCGHGMAKTILLCYARNVLKILEKYKDELEVIYATNNQAQP